MQYKFFGVSITLGVFLLLPFHQASAQTWCDPLFGLCNNPYGTLDQNIQQQQAQNQLQTLSQTQANQATENRLKLQYGIDAYNSCTNWTIDQGNPYEVAIWLNTKEPCMASYKVKQDAKAQCTAGYVYFNGACVSGAQGCLNSWGANSVWTGTGCDCASGYQWNYSKKQCVATPQWNAQSCIDKYGAHTIFTGKYCDCASGYKFNNSVIESALSEANTKCVANTSQGSQVTASPSVNTIPSCAANATYNGSQCVCDSGYFADGNGCVTANTMCVENYGAHSISTGKLNAQGGPICGCADGYDYNSANTTCVRTKIGAAPVAGSFNISVLDNGPTSTPTTTPVVPQKGFWSRLFHIIDPFSWF